jgi:hypothetical protein
VEEGLDQVGAFFYPDVNRYDQNSVEGRAPQRPSISLPA